MEQSGETGNLRYNMLDAGDVAKQDVGFCQSEKVLEVVDFVINETVDGGASTNGLDSEVVQGSESSASMEWNLQW